MSLETCQLSGFACAPNFFYCNNYRSERHLFFEAAREFLPLNTNLQLYGNVMVDNTLNSTLFRAEHDYIKNNKRFDNT